MNGSSARYGANTNYQQAASAQDCCLIPCMPERFDHPVSLNQEIYREVASYMKCLMLFDLSMSRILKTTLVKMMAESKVITQQYSTCGILLCSRLDCHPLRHSIRVW